MRIRDTSVSAKTNRSGLHSGAEGLKVAIIIDVDPGNKACTVALNRFMESHITNVPWISQLTFESGGGFNVYPERGTRVLLAFPMNGQPVIIGSMDSSIPEDIFKKDKALIHKPILLDAAGKQPIKTGQNSEEYGNAAYRLPDNFSGLSPRDAHIGDIDIADKDNEGRLTLFRGGMGVFRISNLAQVMLFKLQGLVRIVSRNFQLFSDFGFLEFRHKEDKLNLFVKGTSAFKDEGHPKKSLWRFWFKAGDGENIIETVVTDPTEDKINSIDDYSTLDPLYKANVKPDGTKEEYSKQTISTTAEKAIREESKTDNIEEKAAKNILNEAQVDVITKALMSIKEEAGVSIEMLSQVLWKVNSKVMQTSSNAFTHTSLFTAITSAVSINGALTVIGPFSPVGPTIGPINLIGPIITGGAGMPNPTINATSFMTKYNSHTHGSATGATGPPQGPGQMGTSDLTETKLT